MSDEELACKEGRSGWKSWKAGGWGGGGGGDCSTRLPNLECSWAGGGASGN